MTTLFLKSTIGQVWELSTPKSITYMWGFGSFLGVVMAVQILSGVFLGFYYVSGHEAWSSVVELTREVSYGWVLRYVHSNFASFVFLILFIHMIRALIQGSFYLTFPWLSGVIIMILTMAAAFLGYVLPWGQMSFWGATVIINLLSVLPMGKTLVIWLWGGFYVSNFTCSFFYTLHFLVPFVVVIMAGIHLILLHKTGSSGPSGLSVSSIVKTKFTHAFLYKDIVNLSFLWVMWLVLLQSPDWAGDPVNFMASDLSNSPIHIQPEWYFLHLYAILRSIPNKVGGLLAFVLALLILILFATLTSLQGVMVTKLFSISMWSFIFVNVLLMWLGMQPVEAPFVFMGQVLSYLYFFFIFVVILTDLFLMFYLK